MLKKIIVVCSETPELRDMTVKTISCNATYLSDFFLQLRPVLEPFCTCYTSASQVDKTKHCFGQLGPEFGNTERGQDEHATYSSAPNLTGTNKLFHLPDEFCRNVVDKPLHAVQFHQLCKLAKLVSSEHRYSHTKAAWFWP